MTCKQFTARIGAWIEGEMTARARTQFELHAAGCSRCSVYVESYRRAVMATRTAFRKNAGTKLPESLVQSIIDEVRKAKTLN